MQSLHAIQILLTSFVWQWRFLEKDVLKPQKLEEVRLSYEESKSEIKSVKFLRVR